MNIKKSGLKLKGSAQTKAPKAGGNKSQKEANEKSHPFKLARDIQLGILGGACHQALKEGNEMKENKNSEVALVDIQKESIMGVLSRVGPSRNQ